jgi:hypothetical protein
MSMPIPSPSPSPSPHSFACLQHSPNIFITSPTSPLAYSSSHSRSPSRESQTHPNPNVHTTLPILSIPNSITTGPSYSHPFHTPSSSPTASDILPNFLRQGHARSQSHLGPRLPRQPNITLTLDTDDGGRAEKRARTGADKVKDASDAGLRAGEEMDVVPSEVGEDVKLPSSMSLTGGTPPPTSAGVGGTKVVGLRSRSDSAPMWGGDGGSVHGGLSANWMGRGRSGSSFGQ